MTSSIYHTYTTFYFDQITFFQRKLKKSIKILLNLIIDTETISRSLCTIFFNQLNLTGDSFIIIFSNTTSSRRSIKHLITRTRENYYQNIKKIELQTSRPIYHRPTFKADHQII